MPRFSANLSTLFQELPFLDRFAAARSAGFEAVEFWFPYDYRPAELRMRIQGEGLTLVGINSPPGGAAEWGLAALPGRERHFRDSIKVALDYAHGLEAGAIHILAGLCGGVDRAAATDSYCANVEWAAAEAQAASVGVLIEPLNGRDRPGYFLSSSDQAAMLLGREGFASVKMMFDCYHVQIAEGDLIRRLQRHLPRIGHIQFAGVPDRHEPQYGEINFSAVFSTIDKMGWQGWVGAEYIPVAGTLPGLGWMRDRRRGESSSSYT